MRGAVRDCAHPTSKNMVFLDSAFSGRMTFTEKERLQGLKNPSFLKAARALRGLDWQLSPAEELMTGCAPTAPHTAPEAVLEQKGHGTHFS